MWSIPGSLSYPLAKLMARYTKRFGTQHSILYRTYDWGIGNDFFILFLFSAVVRFLSLYSTSPCNTGKNPFLDSSILNFFNILSRYVLIEKSSILIYLYRSWCPICKQLHRGLSLKKILSNTPLCFPENSTSFPIVNMSFTYTYQKVCSAPTHFLVNIGFTASLYKTICFDQLIKAYISTLRCLHQSIDGSLELCTLC